MNRLFVRYTVKEQLNQLENILFDEKNRTQNDAPEIAFAISLKSKRSSLNWERVQENLAKTLRSILSNTDQNFRIIIAGHEEPKIQELNHEKVTWISVKFSPPTDSKGFSRDKMQKRIAIGNYLKRINFSGYFMPVDADDWLHYRFVEYIRSLPKTDAFIINKGYMVNLFKSRIWMRNSSFFRGCGTSQIIYFKNEELPNTTEWNNNTNINYKVVLKSHAFIKQQLEKINKKYSMVNYPIVTWVLAHGDNNSILLGKHDRNISAERYRAKDEKLESWFYNSFKISSEK